MAFQIEPLFAVVNVGSYMDRIREPTQKQMEFFLRFIYANDVYEDLQRSDSFPVEENSKHFSKYFLGVTEQGIRFKVEGFLSFQRLMKIFDIDAREDWFCRCFGMMSMSYDPETKTVYVEIDAESG